MSYSVFAKSIETFAETTVPSGPIDRRVLSGLSGADYGSLMSGLRFLGLVNEDRRATEDYRELVQLSKDPAKFKERWKNLVISKYTPIVGHVNLKDGTAAELEKAFKDYGVSVGQMLTKTIRFFLKAMTETGLQLSHYMTAPKPRVPRAGSGTPRKNGTGKAQEEKTAAPLGEHRDQVPEGFGRLNLPGMPDCFIQYPIDLTEAHCQILEASVSLLRTSLSAHGGEKDRKT
jgi:hypothetical protein